VIELELTRSRDDRRLYELAGVGTLRLEGLASRRALAQASGRRWAIARRGFWRRQIEAVADDGSVDGRYEPRSHLDFLMAKSFQAAGMTDSAAVYAGYVRTAWKDADPEIKRLLAELP